MSDTPDKHIETDIGGDISKADVAKHEAPVPGYTLLKAAPHIGSPLDRKGKVCMLTKLFNGLNNNSLAMNDVRFKRMATSMEMFWKMRTAFSDSASNLRSEEEVFVRVSIGSSAYKTVVNYVASQNMYTYAYKFTDSLANLAMAGLIANVYMGITGDMATIPASPQWKAYGSAGLKTATLTLVNNMNLTMDREISVFEPWLIVWRNLALIRLASLELKNGNADNQDTQWISPPTPPVRIVTQEKSINLFSEDGDKVVNGTRYIIEVYKDELDACGAELYWLLGGSWENLDFRWFAAAGVNISPHLASRNLRKIGYEFLYLDYSGAGDPVVDPVKPMCGMVLDPANFPVDFELPVEQNIQMALNILARAWPIIADMGSAFVEICCATFAEAYGGIAAADVSGRNAANTGFDCHLRRGNVSIPVGNTTCSMFTKITSESALVVGAQRKVLQIYQLGKTMAIVRRVVEMEAMSVQMSMRAMGLSIPIVFPGVPWVSIFPAAINDTLESSQRRMDSYVAFCLEKDINQPTSFGIYHDKMMLTLFDAVPPETLGCLVLGNVSEEPVQPLGPIANLGECLVSINAGQMANGMFVSGANGLAGINSNIGEGSKELVFSREGYNSYNTVVGHSKSRMITIDGVLEFEGQSAIGMLGHAVVLKRDTVVTDDEAWVVATSAAKSDSQTSSVYTMVSHTRYCRDAFSTSANFPDGERKHSQMELYVDYCLITFCDLTLAVNCLDIDAYEVVESLEVRMRRISQAWVKLVTARVSGTITAGARLRRPVAKRQRK